MKRPSFRVRHRIPDFRALWVGQGRRLYGCRGRRLLVTEDWGASFSTIGELPGSRRDWAYATRLSRRLLRLGIHSMVITENGTLVLVGRKVLYRVEPGQPMEAVFRIPRGSRPLNLAVDPDNRIYFGEYFDNAERQPVSIFCSEDDGKTWDATHTFDAGAIRHVHGIQYDPYRRGLWVMTGDEDRECLIAFSGDRFGSLDLVTGGSQEARVVSGIPTPHGLLCGTDTPLEDNYILQLDFESRTRKRLVRVQSSVFYCYRYRQGYVFATTAEPSRVNDQRNAYLWFSEDGADWHQIASFRKDLWSMKYFQFGQLFFPSGDSDCEHLIVSPLGLRGHDGACLIGDVADA